MSKGDDQTITDSSSTGNQQSTQQSSQLGWQPAVSGIEQNVLPGLQQWGAQPQQYTGQSYIGPNPMMNQASQQQTGYLGSGGQGVVDQARDVWGQALDPMQYLNAPGAMNPLNLYASQVGRNLDENIRPGYFNQAVGAGQTGGYSSERAQMDLRGQRDASEAIADYGANLYGNLYGQGLGARNAALGQAGNMYGLGKMPAADMYRLGQRDRGEQYQQQQMGNAAQQFAQMEPYNRLSMLGGQLGGYAGLGGTAEGSGTGTGQSTGNQTTTQKTGFDPLGTALSIGSMAMGLPMDARQGSGGMGGMGGFGGMGMGGGGGGFNMASPSTWFGGNNWFGGGGGAPPGMAPSLPPMWGGPL